ncbi:MAG: GNAT family N-acetyltransferase [Phocaeicola sp.]
MALLMQKEGYKLRAPEPEDLVYLLRFENEIAEWGIGSEATGPYSRYQMKQYLAHNSNNIFEDKQLRLLIEDSDNIVVGIIDLTNFDPMHNRAEVGILIDGNYRKEGVATVALELIEEHAFHRLGMHQLYAYVHTSNSACRKLFSRCGFKESGELTDWVRIGNRYASVVFTQKVSPDIK